MLKTYATYEELWADVRNGKLKLGDKFRYPGDAEHEVHEVTAAARPLGMVSSRQVFTEGKP